MRLAFLTLLAFLSLLSTGAVFGYFYAWEVAVMAGLEGADPRTALAAMQQMNDVVRSLRFAPALFGTPLFLFLAAFVASGARAGGTALAFGLAGLAYLGGGLLVTLIFHVPMNETLAAETVPEGREAAAAVWQDYAARWRRLNLVRTATSGVALFLAGIGVFTLSRSTSPRSLSRL